METGWTLVDRIKNAQPLNFIKEEAHQAGQALSNAVHGERAQKVVSEVKSATEHTRTFADVKLHAAEHLATDAYQSFRNLSARDVVESVNKYVPVAAIALDELHNLKDIYQDIKTGLRDHKLPELLIGHHPQKADKIPDGPGDFVQHIPVDGYDRDYAVHVPPGYDGKKPMPVVIVLHGAFEDRDYVEDLTQMSKKADKEGFIAVYPNARGWIDDHIRTWDVSPSRTSGQLEDVDFVRASLDQTKRQLNVDDHRVYIAGFSNGGLMANKVATEMPNQIAAVASVSGWLTGSEKPPEKPIPALIIHGTSDHVVPYNGRTWLSSVLGLPDMKPVDYAASFWKNTNDCTGCAGTEQVSEHVLKKDSSNPRTGAEVLEYIIDGGKHAWPGASLLGFGGKPTQELNATNAVWDFFQRQRKP